VRQSVFELSVDALWEYSYRMIPRHQEKCTYSNQSYRTFSDKKFLAEFFGQCENETLGDFPNPFKE